MEFKVLNSMKMTFKNKENISSFCYQRKISFQFFKVATICVQNSKTSFCESRFCCCEQ